MSALWSEPAAVPTGLGLVQPPQQEWEFCCGDRKVRQEPLFPDLTSSNPPARTVPPPAQVETQTPSSKQLPTVEEVAALAASVERLDCLQDWFAERVDQERRRNDEALAEVRRELTLMHETRDAREGEAPEAQRVLQVLVADQSKRVLELERRSSFVEERLVVVENERATLEQAGHEQRSGLTALHAAVERLEGPLAAPRGHSGPQSTERVAVVVEHAAELQRAEPPLERASDRVVELRFAELEHRLRAAEERINAAYSDLFQAVPRLAEGLSRDPRFEELERRLKVAEDRVTAALGSRGPGSSPEPSSSATSEKPPRKSWFRCFQPEQREVANGDAH